MNEALSNAQKQARSRKEGASWEREGLSGSGWSAIVGLLILGAPALAQYREYYITGRVVDAQKQGIADLEIQLRDEATSSVIHFKTGKDGAFKFAGLPHGVYEATLSKEGYPTTKVEWKFEAHQDTMQRVEIPEIVLASQEQVRARRAGQGDRLGDQGGRRKGQARRIRRSDPRVEGARREEAAGRERLVLPRARLRR